MANEHIGMDGDMGDLARPTAGPGAAPIDAAQLHAFHMASTAFFEQREKLIKGVADLEQAAAMVTSYVALGREALSLLSSVITRYQAQQATEAAAPKEPKLWQQTLASLQTSFAGLMQQIGTVPGISLPGFTFPAYPKSA